VAVSERREAEFYEGLAAGVDVEAGDWMADEYRLSVLRFVEMHGNSELMGALPERDWIVRAPTLRRKLALTAKIQDEVGHAQLLFRLCEDLGKPREEILADLLEGRSKFHNVFHYPTRSWGDVGVIAWLVDAAAILSQKALLHCSYVPYRRVMQRICWEESFHILHGRDIVLALVTGTPEQRALVQEALNRWWEPLMHFHGPATPAERDRDMAWRIKGRANEDLRQEFLDVYVPRIRELGLEIPDPALRHDDESGRWIYTEPDWEKLRQIGRGHGPATAQRLGQRRLSAKDAAWVRRAFALPVAA
jgi:ring-1,2-phenylacetyl-CoA epoxidase subunit PaaA